MNRLIAHLDIDAFFASVEQVIIPALRGKPVAVGSGCIASCSYEARDYGCHAGQPLSEARRCCRSLIVLPGSQAVYHAFAERVWELCREIAPTVETYLDDAYLDLSSTLQLHRDIELTVKQLRERVQCETGLTATTGIGPSRMIARLASKSAKPNGQRLVRPQEVEAFIIDRPVGDLPGVGRKTAETLAKFNVLTVRDLRRLPRENLIELFGKNGDAIFERAWGRDTRVVSQREVPRTISRETTFHKETTDAREAGGMLHYLAERAMKTVRELGLLTRTIKLKVRYADMKQVAGQSTLTAPTCYVSPVFDAILKLLERLHTRRVALRHVGLVLSGFLRADTGQLDLFAKESEHDERLASAMDEVRCRFGFSALTSGQSLNLLGKLRQDDNGFVLRTPSLTK